MTTTGTHVLSYPLPDAWDAAVDGWLTWLVAAGASAPTRRTRRAHIRSVARGLGVPHPKDVTTADLLAILGRPSYSIEHRRGLRASLTSFYRHAVTSGIIVADPSAGLPVIRTPAGSPKPATDEIWEQVLSGSDQRTRLMARLAGEAGLRRAEVAQVHTDDLIHSPEGPQLIVHGKGGKQRVVPISLSLASAMTSASFSGYVFPGKIDGHISPDRVGHLVSKLMPAGWSMHKLRHRFATRGYAGTGNLRAVQEALGHASVATTQRYTAVSSSEVRRVTEAAAGASPRAVHRELSSPEQVVESAPPDVVDESAEQLPGDLDQRPHPEATFESVISGWADVAHCEATTEHGDQCRRAANWRVNLHDCEQALLCGHHMNSWKKRQLTYLRQGRLLSCARCTQDFERFADACSITRL